MIAEGCPESNCGGCLYSALEKAGRPQIFGKILASLPVVAIYEIKPPLLVLFEFHRRAAQKQFTALRRIMTNQQASPNPGRA
jgi:hypothetical protein